jgi:hypothetical protein
MIYRNTEMKLDQIVAYFNDEKINLSPAFQRGHVWSVGTRRKLIANIVQGRPIPAIFLYKEASGSRYSYNILDGKQRLESLILFIGSKRPDFAVKNWSTYFFPSRLKAHVDFWVQLPTGKTTFKDLEEEVVRDLREYAIPTIEINLTDDSHLDEIINLFVDINQQGVTVGRFDIVKAMGANNKLLKSVFGLLAIREQRQQDLFYKSKSNDFTQVLKKLDSINTLTDGKSQVDRMWQSLLEIALFYQSKKHRKPVDILKSFISGSHDATQRFPALSMPQQKALRKLFKFVNRAYKTSPLGTTSLATDQTRFYTMMSTLIATDVMVRITEDELVQRLVAFGNIVDGNTPKPTAKKLLATVNRYVLLSSDRTTDTPRRDERQTKFVEAIDLLDITGAGQP